jgi:hypothetical protein
VPVRTGALARSILGIKELSKEKAREISLAGLIL